MASFLFRRLLLAGLFAVAAAGAARAEGPRLLGRFGDWTAYAAGEGQNRLCYAVSQPRRTFNGPRGRGEAYFTVTDRPALHSFDVISVAPGYPFQKGSVPELDVDGDLYDLYVQDGTAWSRNDKAIVESMLTGGSVIMHGRPPGGGDAADTYPLDGFARAHAALGAACGN